MLSSHFESQVLSCINEQAASSAKPANRITLKALLQKFAPASQKSQELELDSEQDSSRLAFDKTNVFRTLMTLNDRGLIDFIGASGRTLTALEINNLYSRFMSGTIIGEVSLSERGLQELRRFNSSKRPS